ncbi:hypothetical protein ACQ4PT_018933 [Festuca glaucescens]
MEAPLLVAALVLLSSTLAASDFCVCRSDQPQAALQKTIDYACGAGADCNSIHEQGPCYNPNNVVAHCSWAANSYFQRKRGAGATCDFTGTATLTTTDPSSSGCSYPSSASAAGTATTGAGIGTGGATGGTPGTGTGPFTPGAGTTGTTGTAGFGGIGPTGTSNMDTAAAASHHPMAGAGPAAFLAVLLSLVAFA